ncbi:MAG: hypothetical protein PHU93_04895, partial [Candidatus Gracilibacteria bacterium]|nr:hypothetical protein [Candidatus Gracilibacteria bacterium]
VVNGKKPRVTRERYMKIRSLVWKELCGKPVVPLSTLKGHLAFLHDADRVGYSKLKKSLSNKVEKSVMRKVFL